MTHWAHGTSEEWLLDGKCACGGGDDRAVYRERINELIHVLSVVNYRLVSADGLLSGPDDDLVLATAIVGQANRIVSLNTRDFPIGGEVAGVHFVTPEVFLTELETRFPAAHLPIQARDAGRQLP